MLKYMVALPKSRIFGLNSQRIFPFTKHRAGLQSHNPFQNIFAKGRSTRRRLSISSGTRAKRMIPIFEAGDSAGKSSDPAMERAGA